jgi:hypothetical protein
VVLCDRTLPCPDEAVAGDLLRPGPLTGHNDHLSGVPSHPDRHVAEAVGHRGGS